MRKKPKLLEALKLPFPEINEEEYELTEDYKIELDEIKRKNKGKFEVLEFDILKLYLKEVIGISKNKNEFHLNVIEWDYEFDFVGINIKKVEENILVVYFLFANEI